MEVKETAFKDVFICNPKVIKDDRGYFYESFNLQKFEAATGIAPNFVQDNQSRSTFGVLRGLHFQVGEMAQAKLVRVLEGEVLDVIVDLRKEEPTFGKSFSIVLNDKNATQVYIPKGFAHGFLVMTSYATFAYKCDNYYDKTSERGLMYNDPKLDINWLLGAQDFILSEKDKGHPDFDTLIQNL